MNIRNKKKLQKILLLMSIGSAMVTENVGATSYAETLTGEAENDSAHGYSINQTIPGELIYNFNLNDQIEILVDHSTFSPNTVGRENYYAIKIEPDNNNKLGLNNLKNITIDMKGISGVIPPNDLLDLYVHTDGVNDQGSGELIFGDNTHINLTQTSGDLNIGSLTSTRFESNFNGVDQSGSSTQIFGNNTQIILSDTSGDLDTQSDNSTKNLILTGIGQY